MLSALGVGFLLGAPLVRALVDRVSPGYLLGGTLAATAVGFGLLFGSTPMATALPAAVVTGAFGSTALVVVKTSVRRITPNELLGRVGSALFTAEAVAAFAGPVIAEASSPATATLVACGGTVLSGVLAVVPLPRSVHTGHRETDARSVTWSSDG
ncbi:MFS transporter [Umezawaea sp.]|uniref:MFS transporter n=1 Tax=Umezawaea sp. TaxID=1955258 RepID=UPI002ED4D90A